MLPRLSTIFRISGETRQYTSASSEPILNFEVDALQKTNQVLQEQKLLNCTGKEEPHIASLKHFKKGVDIKLEFLLNVYMALFSQYDKVSRHQLFHAKMTDYHEY